MTFPEVENENVNRTNETNKQTTTTKTYERFDITVKRNLHLIYKTLYVFKLSQSVSKVHCNNWSDAVLASANSKYMDIN